MFLLDLNKIPLMTLKIMILLCLELLQNVEILNLMLLMSMYFQSVAMIDFNTLNKLDLKLEKESVRKLKLL